MSNTEKFNFPLPLKDTDDFERFMQEADRFLLEQGYRPYVRAGMLPRLLRELLKLRRSSDIEFHYSASAVGVGHSQLTQAYDAWYADVYGEQIQPSTSFMPIPVGLGFGVWRMRLPRYLAKCVYFIDRDLTKTGIPSDEYGVGGSYNVLNLVEGITPGLVARLSDATLDALQFLSTNVAASLSNWEDAYPDTKLFEVAKSDYACSTDSLMHARLEQSMWASQQSLEKTMKGFLTLAKIDYPRDKDGHDLKGLGTLLHPIVDLPGELLTRANVHTKVRYGEVRCTQQSALAANWAVLEAQGIFAKSRKAQGLLERWWAEEA